jgi:glycosyltransferase involved in cell wall biosynthesis
MDHTFGKELIREKMVKRVAMVVYSYYPDDTRVRREAEALIEAGMSVDVFCLRDKGEEEKSQVNNVLVYRLPLKRKRSGRLNYLLENGFFIFLAFVTLSLYHLRKPYHVIHVHNMPDILVISALIARLTGAKVILDLHDPMPEIYITKFEVSELHPIIRFLKFLEKCCIRFADIVLTPNIAFRDLFVRRGCPPWKIHIVMNTAQETIFKCDSNVAAIGSENGFVIMYHGTFLAHNGLDLALKAIARVKEEIPNLKFEVYGDGEFRDEFLKLVHELKLNSTVKYHGPKPVEHIAEAIKSINLGVIPNKRTRFTDLNLPTRIFEYLAMKKPVIAPRTKGIMDYFDENSLLFFEPGSVDSLKNIILNAYRDPLGCQDILKRGINVLNNHRWELNKNRFIDVVKNAYRV